MVLCYNISFSGIIQAGAKVVLDNMPLEQRYNMDFKYIKRPMQVYLEDISNTYNILLAVFNQRETKVPYVTSLFPIIVNPDKLNFRWKNLFLNAIEKIRAAMTDQKKLKLAITEFHVLVTECDERAKLI